MSSSNRDVAFREAQERLSVALARIAAFFCINGDRGKCQHWLTRAMNVGKNSQSEIQLQRTAMNTFLVKNMQLDPKTLAPVASEALISELTRQYRDLILSDPKLSSNATFIHGSFARGHVMNRSISNALMHKRRADEFVSVAKLDDEGLILLRNVLPDLGALAFKESGDYEAANRYLTEARHLTTRIVQRSSDALPDVSWDAEEIDLVERRMKEVADRMTKDVEVFRGATKAGLLDGIFNLAEIIFNSLEDLKDEHLASPRDAFHAARLHAIACVALLDGRQLDSLDNDKRRQYDVMFSKVIKAMKLAVELGFRDMAALNDSTELQMLASEPEFQKILVELTSLSQPNPPNDGSKK